mmetsp:Transcript_71569/g.170912  ORF Transcript_71569/g.170912 Transcript_71569/m.170912 type:complete len:234 (-) Transcript_71569:254-955(-)
MLLQLGWRPIIQEPTAMGTCQNAIHHDVPGQGVRVVQTKSWDDLHGSYRGQASFRSHNQPDFLPNLYLFRIDHQPIFPCAAGVFCLAHLDEMLGGQLQGHVAQVQAHEGRQCTALCMSKEVDLIEDQGASGIHGQDFVPDPKFVHSLLTGWSLHGGFRWEAPAVVSRTLLLEIQFLVCLHPAPATLRRPHLARTMSGRELYPHATPSLQHCANLLAANELCFNKRTTPAAKKT